MARIMVRALLAGKPPAKLEKVYRRLCTIADEMEEASLACANVFPINGHGQPFGGRSADLERHAAATALRDALRAELPAALSTTRNLAAL